MHHGCNSLWARRVQTRPALARRGYERRGPAARLVALALIGGVGALGLAVRAEALPAVALTAMLAPAPAAAAEPAGQAAAGGDQAALCAEFEHALDKIVATRGQEGDSARLARLFDSWWRFELADQPEGATFIGHSEHDDQWSDVSPEAFARRRALVPKVVAAAESIDRSRLGEDERLNYDLFLRRARLDAEGSRFPAELLPITQLYGVQQDAPELLSRMPARTVAQYDNILARLRRLPRRIEQTVTLLHRGLAAGVTPPRITLRDVPEQVQALLIEDPAKSPLLAAFAKFPDTVPERDRERLRREAAAALHDDVLPALRALHAYLADSYVPHARESIAMSDLPDGRAWYALNVKVSTTTDLTPEQIHQLGLAEVKRIRALMDQVIASVGFKGSFTDFLTFLRTDPRFYYDDPQALLTGYRDICKRIDPGLIKIFGRLPRLPYGVEPVPAYAEKSQTTAYYEGGSLAGGQAGTFFANTYNLKARPKWGMESLTLHESVPGHHLQISLAAELEGGPEWRRYNDYTAYVEGWGLYAEGLGGELGLYTDPYSKFGQLSYEVWRAIRLVVDTGLHTMGWSRQRAIDYFKANSANTEQDITVEVDRYIVTPGQATAYKIGQLKLRELRAFAEQQLGPGFDERAFHDEVLDSGALPLDVLDARVRAWVAAQAQRTANAARDR
jgi:uncharacterized protein (DUF885 family)